MTAAILSIGTELTRGELVNSNAAWLAEQLTLLGFEVFEHATIDDDRTRIVETLKRLAETARVIVTTGGLGPTTDDLTSEAVAMALGVDLDRDEASLEKIRRRWESFGMPMPESNVKQAEFPRGAEILPNPTGTAPGFAVALGQARCFFLPGVPREMKDIFRESVLPAIALRGERTTHQVHLRSFGMTESQVGEALSDLETSEEGIVLGYRASFPEIEVKVLAKAATEAEAEEKARRVAEIARTRLGDAVYGERDDTFAGAVGRVLRAKGLTLSVAESCTGGLIGGMLTSVPGSSDYLLLDAVVYSNAAKTTVLGVSQETLRAHGAVSAETACEMAEGALRISGSDLSVAVTGIAGPGGATEGKPVGTVFFALAQKDGPTITKSRKLPGDRERIRTIASYVALKLVMRAAKGDPVEL